MASASSRTSSAVSHKYSSRTSHVSFQASVGSWGESSGPTKTTVNDPRRPAFLKQSNQTCGAAAASASEAPMMTIRIASLWARFLTFRNGDNAVRQCATLSG